MKNQTYYALIVLLLLVLWYRPCFEKYGEEEEEKYPKADGTFYTAG
jgi:hypothetical protein